MGVFITDKARMEQTNVPGYWKIIDNELFLTDRSELILTPRYLWSDGYTFPGLVMAIIGDKNYYDTRPCHGHDLFCRYHEKIVVKDSITHLKIDGYIKTFKGKTICEDIPLNKLSIIKISKWEADELFKEMMLSCDIPTNVVNKIRFGVKFNLNWYWRTGRKSVHDYNLYQQDLDLVEGL